MKVCECLCMSACVRICVYMIVYISVRNTHLVYNAVIIIINVFKKCMQLIII